MIELWALAGFVDFYCWWIHLELMQIASRIYFLTRESEVFVSFSEVIVGRRQRRILASMLEPTSVRAGLPTCALSRLLVAVLLQANATGRHRAAVISARSCVLGRAAFAIPFNVRPAPCPRPHLNAESCAGRLEIKQGL